MSDTYLIAGIDPGAHTGLVVVEVPFVLPPSDRLTDVLVWRASTRLNPITRKGLKDEDLSVLVFERLRDRIKRWGITAAAIECPADAMDAWRPGKKGAGVGTSFALGRAYERAMLACMLGGAVVHSYRVREWMPQVRTNNRPHTQKREKTLADLDTLSRVLRRPRQPEEGLVKLGVARQALDRLSEDELMALGVLRYHLARHAPLPLLGVEQRNPPAATGVRRVVPAR